MCTERHITFTNCQCTPTLILKCPAQEFVEKQAAKKNRNPIVIYRHCVNLMVTRDLVNGCCKGKADGRCFAERGGGKMQRHRQEEKNMDDGAEVGRTRPLEPTDGRIAM
jgi:hypothetical protein